MQIELTPSQFEIRAGDVIDGVTFDASMMVYLNQDKKTVRAVLANGEGKIPAVTIALCNLFARQGFVEAEFTHKGKSRTINLKQSRFNYNENGMLCRVIIDETGTVIKGGL